MRRRAPSSTGSRRRLRSSQACRWRARSWRSPSPDAGRLPRRHRSACSRPWKPSPEADYKTSVTKEVIEMRQVLVRYRVKPERVEENDELVRAVYEELRSTEPAGLRYATFKLEDGVTFVHLAVIERENEDSPLSRVRAFREFKEHLDDRTDEGRLRTELDRVGSDRLLGDSSEQ